MQTIEFTCTCPTQCRLCLFTVTVISLLQVGLCPFIAISMQGMASRSKGITITNYIISHYSFCQSGSAESDWITYQPQRNQWNMVDSCYVNRCQVPPLREGGQLWRSWLQEALSLGRSLDPWDSTRGCPAISPAPLNPLFIVCLKTIYRIKIFSC